METILPNSQDLGNDYMSDKLYPGQIHRWSQKFICLPSLEKITTNSTCKYLEEDVPFNESILWLISNPSLSQLQALKTEESLIAVTSQILQNVLLGLVPKWRTAELSEVYCDNFSEVELYRENEKKKLVVQHRQEHSVEMGDKGGTERTVEPRQRATKHGKREGRVQKGPVSLSTVPMPGSSTSPRAFLECSFGNSSQQGRHSSHPCNADWVTGKM